VFKETPLLLSRIEELLKASLDFALYRSPKSDQVVLLQLSAIKDEAHHSFDDLWVTCPFSTEHTPFYYRVLSEESFMLDSNFGDDQFKTLDVPDSTLNDYRLKVVHAIDEIGKGLLNKVVLHTQIEVSYSKEIHRLIHKVLAADTEGFRYSFYSAELGLWMGITPEVLVQSAHKDFKTMALAGTRKLEDLDTDPFKEKERAEQAWVTKEIVELLNKSADFMHVGEVETVKAGKLAHLRTIIKGEIKPHLTTADIASVLHPTAAVCGYPKSLAYRYIEENEILNRSLYSGYLGRVQKESSSLYVNLRCMSYQEGMIKVYVGAGITADSDPELETEEIRIKTSTLASILMA
jgi:isochorismate synthase